MDTDVNNNNDKANHCVYISFDNNDQSISFFINYLKATFNHHGIYQLDDQSDRLADRIKILVVVFSKEDTFSAPENLVNQLPKKDLVVVPVLYKVTILSARQNAMLDQVLLDSSAVLPGHIYNEERSEYEFTKEIARDVCEKLYPTAEIGIHRRQKEIENLLCKQPWGVRTLGIFGKPGIGKTTLAIALFRHMSGGYDASCLIKDFDTKYNGKRLDPLDPDYLSEIPMEEFDQNCIDSEPINRKKRVLIALDDVRNAPDAKSFLGGFDKFGPGSLIIITSQNEQILKECQVSVFYELKGLNDEEALELFTRCAFGNIVIEEDPLDLSKNEIKSKTMVEMVSTLPDVCEVLIAENKCIRLIPYEEYNEAKENKEFQSDNDAVSATRDTDIITLTTSDLCSKSYPQKNLRSRIYKRFSKSLPRNLRLYRLDYNSMIRSLSEHLQKHHNDILQGVASQLQKLSQSFLNSRDHDLLEQNLQRLFTLSGGCDRIKRFLDLLRKNRELNRKGRRELEIKLNRD
ncbi:hypothetical protein HID58_076177 [Brassica napus]|uniref:BnaC09g20620D protein n=3 Tax=Brassica TaxID=3705 RepID=A0A078IHP1_BRANA|nr:probable disease resistance protein At4g19520 [Brassica napus]KAG2264849.1 hypothetical protein Bca52824_071928 [Brassica carinata]KAH0869155.1 hypothetical protein HID58_076177 [Brassica napus]CAF1991317.1 unnamed protein product [Brassica napus]CDY48623.1 BnaC09g20620D [Brassica napus]